MQKISCQQLTDSIVSLQTKQRNFDVLMNHEARNVPSTIGIMGSIEQEIEEIKEILAQMWLFERIPLIEQQYQSQVEILRTAGILEKLSSGKEGIIGIDNKEYEMPTLEVVMAQIYEKRKIMGLKIEQGFDKLLIVPFAKELGSLFSSAKKIILAQKSADKLFSTDGVALDLNTSTPLWVHNIYQDADINGNLIYYPKEYSDNHQGKTKTQILLEPSGTPGWQVMLIEDMPDLPGKNSTDANPLGGRKQFESGKSPDEYLRIQQDDPVYNHESFFTPESWLAYFLTHLVETDQAIDNYNGEDGVRYLATAYFPDTCKVPDGSWNIDDCQADLEVSSPSKADESCGIAAIVRIT